MDVLKFYNDVTNSIYKYMVEKHDICDTNIMIESIIYRHTFFNVTIDSKKPIYLDVFKDILSIYDHITNYINTYISNYFNTRYDLDIKFYIDRYSYIPFIEIDSSDNNSINETIANRPDNKDFSYTLYPYGNTLHHIKPLAIRIEDAVDITSFSPIIAKIHLFNYNNDCIKCPDYDNVYSMYFKNIVPTFMSVRKNNSNEYKFYRINGYEFLVDWDKSYSNTITEFTDGNTLNILYNSKEDYIHTQKFINEYSEIVDRTRYSNKSIANIITEYNFINLDDNISDSIKLDTFNNSVFNNPIF